MSSLWPWMPRSRSLYLLTGWDGGAAAVQAYAEWAPAGRMASAGLVGAAGYLLGVPEYALPACHILQLISARKQAQVCLILSLSSVDVAFLHTSQD